MLKLPLFPPCQKIKDLALLPERGLLFSDVPAVLVGVAGGEYQVNALEYFSYSLY